MGFGLLALGYIFLNFYTTGADLVGYIVMLFALLKLSKIEKSFKNSIFAVVLLIPVGLFNLFGFVDTAFDLGIFRDYGNDNFVQSIAPTERDDVSFVNNDNSQTLEEISQTADDSSQSSETSKEIVDTERKKRTRIAESIFNAIFIFGSLCFHYFFYKSARKLALRTDCAKLAFKANRNMFVNIVFFAAWGLLTAGGTNVALLNILTTLHFVLLIFNFIYIYSCYATFSIDTDDGDEQ